MILVFGKKGQVATEVQSHKDVISIGRDQADLSIPESCIEAIRRNKPRAVINAAAYTAVDKAESEEKLANQINGDAPGAIAVTCAELDIPLVHLSTDYVFDGTANAPYREDHPLNPIGYRSKFWAEVSLG